MNEELVSQVEELGLSEKEARVYIANLTIGPSPVQKIADFAGIKRVTTYVILESLVNLGLVSQTVKGKKTFFIAEEPMSLRRLIEKKEKQLAEQKENFENIMPDLTSLKSLPKEAPTVKFYDSPEGIRTIVKTFFATHNDEGFDTVYGVSNLDQLYSFFPEMRESRGNQERVQAGIKSKFLYTSTEGPVYQHTDIQKMRESRYVPIDMYPFSGDMTIIGDNLVMLSLEGSRPIGVTIHSHELASSMKVLFDLAWRTAESYNK